MPSPTELTGHRCMMGTFRHTGLTLALLLLPSACGPAEEGKRREQVEQALSPEAAASARRTIMSWLECEECTEGQLDSVLTLGAVAVPSLSAALLQGPSPARLAEHKRDLSESYQQQRQYSRSHPAAAPRMSETEHLAVYTRNLLALYRVRAAIALERIGGPEAAEALTKALSLQLRDDERRVVQAASKRVRG